MMFAVERIINQRRKSGHLVATSLFWKQPILSGSPLGSVTLSALMSSTRYIYGRVQSPWTQYVIPLLDAAKLIRSESPETTFRVYLAADMNFLIDKLIEVGCEIHLMKGSSLAHNPGAMWRFLAMQEGHRGVTIIDCDRGSRVLGDISRTKAAIKAGLAGWRIPYEFGVNYARDAIEGYRPINASQFGVTRDFEIEGMMKDFVANSIAGEVESTVRVRVNQTFPIAGAVWPNYGFDEWFLQSRFYRDFVRGGVITFIPARLRTFSQYLPLDIEFATRSNPLSEVVFFEDQTTLSMLNNDYKDSVNGKRKRLAMPSLV